jgi:hypothetical protein
MLKQKRYPTCNMYFKKFETQLRIKIYLEKNLFENGLNEGH